MITGCFSPAPGPTSGNTSEIYNPFTKTSCSLPELTEDRYRFWHTQDGDLSCGGTRQDCIKWSPASGTWTKSHTLRERRQSHVSWVTASGVYLIGGYYSLRSSEKVKVDGSVEDGFGLKYDTWYTLHSKYDINTEIHLR